MSEPIRHTNEQMIYDHVLEAIYDHRLLPGTKLPEDSLGEVFGVSRTVVRRALGRLAHENMVEVRPHRITRVAKPTPEEARDVFGARITIEQETVRGAAQNADQSRVKVLSAIEVEESKAAESGDRGAWIKLSGAYHLMIAEQSGNAVLTRFLQELVARTSLILALHQPNGSAICADDAHQAITAAIAEKDEDRAAACMRAHLIECEHTLNPGEEHQIVDLADVFRATGTKTG